MKNFLKLCGAVLICEAAGAIGSVFTMSAVTTWYSTLTKPALNPPSWIFGPVWTTLYLLMGIALFLVIKKGWHHHDVKVAGKIFLSQLVLNALWSVIFFGIQSPAWAFLTIIGLWVGIVLTIISFHKISKAAAYLLVPYLLWVTFASYLNFAIWMLNR